MTTSAPKPDPDPDQVTVYGLDHLMLVLVGSLFLFPVSGAVIWFFVWLGNPGIYLVGTMGVAATQLCVGILGIVLLFRGNVNNGKGRKLR